MVVLMTPLGKKKTNIKTKKTLQLFANDLWEWEWFATYYVAVKILN